MASGGRLEDSFAPAAYGRACTSCSRAKCKCFYRPEGSVCERCHRLGKHCEPAVSTRKRKVASPHRQAVAPQQPLPPRAAPPPSLENKLDDLVSLLRTQVDRQNQAVPLAPHSVLETTPSSSDAAESSKAAPQVDVRVDTDGNTVHLLRANSPPASSQPIFEDVCAHQVPDSRAEEQLATFRRAFLPMFPFVHIRGTMRAHDLRHEKPFLWLNIMALATKTVSEQFAIEETIWQIISRRIVAQHFVNMDLLLGVVCFASWSHYYKKDKPFMTTLSQLAVSLACELGLQGNVPVQAGRRGLSPRPGAQQSQRRRTLEERRTILSVFHLTSATWAAYRKTEPMRWSQYLDTCLNVISVDGARIETSLDAVLAAQVRCHLITNDILFDSLREDRGTATSTMVTTVLLRQLGEAQQSLPIDVRCISTMQLYFCNCELSIWESSLRKGPGSGTFADTQRVKDLDSVLVAIEGWLDAFSKLPLIDLIGIHVDNFTQFLHCVVVLFKLTTLEEPGWDLEEVRRRADVFKVLDSTGQELDNIARVRGMIDAEGPRSGLFFKAKHLWRAIKALLLAEMPANLVSPEVQILQKGDQENDASVDQEEIPTDLFRINLADEPWLSDIFSYDWAPEGHL